MNYSEIEKLNTEKNNSNTRDIDILSTQQILTKINEEDQKVPGIVASQIDAITQLVDELYLKVQQGGRLIYIGAGTSGRLGVLDASECPPTFGVDKDLVQGIIAGGKEAMFIAQEGAEDSETDAVEDLKAIGLSELDFVVGIAASGRTPYVMSALRYANTLGAGTGSIACVKNSKIGEIAKFPIEVVTEAEAITGSTRMKAGTAQKLVLNMISTTLMIKLGKTYQNYMVDLQPTNSKLEKRAVRMIAELLSLETDQAYDLYIQSGKHVKLALVMYLAGLNLEEAQATLDANQGHIRLAINNLA